MKNENNEKEISITEAATIIDLVIKLGNWIKSIFTKSSSPKAIKEIKKIKEEKLKEI